MANAVAVPVSPLTEEQLRTLMSPLNSQRISHRKQGSSNLSYLEAWDVKATLIRVFGFGGFSAECIETDVFDIREVAGTGKPKFAVSARCTVRLTIHQLGVVFTESAASSQVGSQGIGDVADFAIKTAESDALKRAAIYLGTQFGLSLYNAGSTQEVIRVIVAPTQLWLNGAPRNPAPALNRAPANVDPVQAISQIQQEPIAQEQMSPPEEPVTEAEANQAQPVVQLPPPNRPVEPAPVQQVAPQGAEQLPGYVQHQNVTPEQHAENTALLERALGATPVAEQQAPQA